MEQGTKPQKDGVKDTPQKQDAQRDSERDLF